MHLVFSFTYIADCMTPNYRSAGMITSPKVSALANQPKRNYAPGSRPDRPSESPGGGHYVAIFEVE